MKFKMYHQNFNVLDLDRSLKFYEEALGLTPKKWIHSEDGSFEICYVGNDETDFLLELTWIKEMDRPYDLGDEEFHLAFHADDYDEALKHHKEMGCVAMENTDMGIYFIQDPDGYWLEIVPYR